MAAVGGYGAPPGQFGGPMHGGPPMGYPGAGPSDQPPKVPVQVVDSIIRGLKELQAQQAPPEDEAQCTISVYLEDCQMSYELSEADIYDTFIECGPIRTITFPRENVVSQVHVIFERSSAVQRAMSLDKFPMEEIRPGISARLRVVKFDPRAIDQQLSMKYDLCPELFLGEPTFNITTLILGEGHAHMQHIMKESKNLVDIHIKGKASIQVPEEERLQIVLKSHDRPMFEVACDLLTDLLKSTCDKFLRWFIAHYPNTNPVKPQFTATRNDNIYDGNEPRQTTHGPTRQIDNESNPTRKEVHVAPGWDQERLRRREQQHYDQAVRGRGPAPGGIPPRAGPPGIPHQQPPPQAHMQHHAHYGHNPGVRPGAGPPGGYGGPPPHGYPQQHHHQMRR